MRILSAILPVGKSGVINAKTNLSKIVNENLKTMEKPIIANLKSYYRSGEEKLNDIFLDRTRNKLTTSTVEYNIDKFERLPQVIKDSIKPSDIRMSGSINQNRVDDLWEAAKKARKPGVHGPAPVFRGDQEDEIAQQFEELPDLNVTDSALGAVANSTELTENISDHIETFSDMTQDLHEHGADLLEHLSEYVG